MLYRFKVKVVTSNLRYYDLIDEGLPNDMVAPLSQDWVRAAYTMIPPHLISNFPDVRLATTVLAI